MSKLTPDFDTKELALTQVITSTGETVPLNSLYKDSVLLVFVRHFGCVGCTMQMRALAPRLEEFHTLGIPTVVVGNGEAKYIQGFIERFQLQNKPIQIVTDPSLTIFKIAKFKRSFWATYGPLALWDYVKGFVAGVLQKTFEGDLTQQGGTILLNKSQEVVYYHQNQHVTDLSNLSDVVDEVYKLLVIENEDYV